MRAGPSAGATATGRVKPTALPMRAMLGRIGREGPSAIACPVLARCQPGVADRDPGDTGAAPSSGWYQGRPSSSNSLEREGTVMMRPSNSGTATWLATSSGDSPSSLASLLPRPRDGQPCRMGMSRAAKPFDVPCLVLPRPPTPPAGVVPPAARTMAMRASAVPRSSMSSSGAVRNDEQNTGSGRAPAASMAAQSASAVAVFPARCCAR